MRLIEVTYMPLTLLHFIQGIFEGPTYKTRPELIINCLFMKYELWAVNLENTELQNTSLMCAKANEFHK